MDALSVSEKKHSVFCRMDGHATAGELEPIRHHREITMRAQSPPFAAKDDPLWVWKP
jgi:hypothetical protein